jgi:hypothetical protein
VIQCIETDDMIPAEEKIIFKISWMHNSKINLIFARYEIPENLACWTDDGYCFLQASFLCISNRS